MRFALLSVLIFLVSGIFFGVIPVQAAGGLIPCDGPECQACHFIQLGQNLLNWFIKTMAAVITLIFAWGGMKMVMSGGNTEGVSEAKGMMTNAVIGFFILLASWLVINTVLVSVISKDSSIQERLGEGMWNQIECVAPPTRTTATGGGASNADVVTGPGAGVLCNNSFCSPSVLQEVGFTPAQANVMSCLAMTESSGDPSIVNKNGGACGLFQILPSNWANPNLHKNTYCSRSSCQSAKCNAEAAYALTQGRVKNGQPRYGDWTCPGCNAKAQACVQKYDPASI